MTDKIDIAVLRRGTHGMPASEYVSELRTRLPDQEIALATTPQEEQDLVQNAPIVSSVDIDDDVLDQAENLRLFAGVAAGYDHLPLERFEEMEISVTNASGIHAPNIAEQVLAYILSHTRRLDEGRRRQERQEWRHYQAEEFKDSTVTVVGLGAIGEAVVDRLAGFDVETIGVRYSPEKGGPTDEVVGFDDESVHNALARTDHLVLASPLTETTKHLIDGDAFETLLPDAYVVNVGRGPIIDTDALVDAIQSNAIAGAALDVTDPEPLPQDHILWQFENVTITPHHAGHSPKHWSRLADIVAENVKRIEETGSYDDLRNQVL